MATYQLRILILIVVFTQAEFVSAQAPGPLSKREHPGYLHGKKALEYEGELQRWQANPKAHTVTEDRQVAYLKKIQDLEKKMFLEQQKTFASYHHTPRNQVDIGLLNSVFDSHIKICTQEPNKFNCDESLKEALIVYRHLDHVSGNKAQSLSREKQVAHFFFARRNYQEAYQVYLHQYLIISRSFCSEEHIDVLRRMLTSQLNLEKQSEFRRYWEIAKKCEGMGYLRAKGLRFVHYDSIKEVQLQALSAKRH